MATNPDTIWEALRNRLEERAPSFRKVVRYSRKDWPLESMPVLELREDGDETSEQTNGLPPLWTHRGEVAIIAYTAKDDRITVPPMSQLHSLVHEVRAALERQTNDAQGSGEYGSDACDHWTNLGGLVESLSVGPVKKGLGDASGTGLATIAIDFKVY